MSKAKIVIVDDSLFSRALTRDILKSKGFEVVGEAGCLEEVISVVSETKPDLVTMDITMPGADGFQCTKEVHNIDPNIKVIIASSMMDDEIIKKAKDHKVVGYVQKPIDEEELITVINRVMENEELFQQLQSRYFLIFKEAFSDTLNRMTKTIANYKDESISNETLNSRGLSVAIGIIGKYSGRMILDMSIDTAMALTKTTLKRECKNTNEVIALISEFANIVAGNACSIMNRENKILGLRVSPPSAFYGESLNVSSALFKTTSVSVDTAFGEIFLNVGFNRGENQWM